MRFCSICSDSFGIITREHRDGYQIDRWFPEHIYIQKENKNHDEGRGRLHLGKVNRRSGHNLLLDTAHFVVGLLSKHSPLDTEENHEIREAVFLQSTALQLKSVTKYIFLYTASIFGAHGVYVSSRCSSFCPSVRLPLSPMRRSRRAVEAIFHSSRLLHALSRRKARKSSSFHVTGNVDT